MCRCAGMLGLPLHFFYLHTPVHGRGLATILPFDLLLGVSCRGLEWQNRCRLKPRAVHVWAVLADAIGLCGFIGTKSSPPARCKFSLLFTLPLFQKGIKGFWRENERVTADYFYHFCCIMQRPNSLNNTNVVTALHNAPEFLSHQATSLICKI